MSPDHSEKVVLITGGSRGIGAACALLAAKQGYKVCVNFANNEKAALDAVSEIENNGGIAIAVKGDVAIEAGIIDTDIHSSGGSPNRVEELKHVIPMQRGGSAMEVAEAALWLMSNAASYVTGTTVDVSGGR